jgi:hypothetical protein
MSNLMIREQQRVRDNDVFSPSCRKHNHLRDIIWRQRITTTVHDQRLLALLLSTRVQIIVKMENSLIYFVCFLLVEAVADIVELLSNMSTSANQSLVYGSHTVRTWPGSTVITRILVLISSFLSASLNARIAALLEQYIYTCYESFCANLCYANRLLFLQHRGLFLLPSQERLYRPFPRLVASERWVEWPASCLLRR